MSGRKQHYIPAFFIQGFASQGVGKAKQVCVMPKSNNNYIASTSDICAERDFYSIPDQSGTTLDDEISTFESDFAPKLVELRKAKACDLLDANVCSQLVTHLIVRNKFFTLAASAAFKQCMSKFAEQLMNSPNSSNKLFAKLNVSRRKIIAEQAKKTTLNRKSRRHLKAKAKAEWETLFQDIIPEFVKEISEQFINLNELAKSAQRKTLKQSMHPAGWTEKLKELNWKLAWTRHDLLLPDCVAITLYNSGAESPLVLSDLDEADAVVIPISTNSVLIGAVSGEGLDKIEETLLLNINERLASCAWEFCILTPNSIDHSSLKSQIGGSTHAMLESYVREILG